MIGVIINNERIYTIGSSVSSPNRKRRPRDIILSFTVNIIFIAALFISAGSLAWTWGWVLAGVMLINRIVSLLLLDPGLLEERTSVKPGYKGEDLLLSTIMGRLGPLAVIIVSGLDFRFGWSAPFPLAGIALGFIFLVFGYILVLWAMRENKFFSSIVRIQKERGHRVIMTGPYAIVRHPGYLGSFIHMAALPFALASWWALIPAVTANIFSLARIVVEDNTLKQELEGYTQYTEKVHYRLIPGIW